MVSHSFVVGGISGAARPGDCIQYSGFQTSPQDVNWAKFPKLAAGNFTLCTKTIKILLQFDEMNARPDGLHRDGTAKRRQDAFPGWGGYEGKFLETWGIACGIYRRNVIC